MAMMLRCCDADDDDDRGSWTKLKVRKELCGAALRDSSA